MHRFKYFSNHIPIDIFHPKFYMKRNPLFIRLGQIQTRNQETIARYFAQRQEAI